MKTMLIYAATGIALLAGTAALAQTSDAAQAAPRAMADKAMTRAEVQARVREHFAKMDANKDGVLTTEEAGKRGHRMKRQMMVMRGDGEGAMHADPNAMFDRLDANKDGSISRAEFAAHHQVRIEKRVVVRDGKPGETGMRDGMRGHRMGGMMMLKMADANKDGRVTLAEAEGAALRHFDMADANRDGQVTRDERRQMRERMRAERNATHG